MERKLKVFFETQTMPEDCAQKIATQMTRHPKPMIQWRRCTAAAAAMLILVLAVFNVDAISTRAASIWDEIATALKPEVAEELYKEVGKVDEGVYNGYGNLEYSEINGVSSGSWGGADFVEVFEDRLIFTGNGEYIDITDLCSEEEAFIYTLDSGNGTIHYLCVGGTPENYGYCEFIYVPTVKQPWKGGGGSNHLDRNNDWEPYGWFVDVKDTLGHPYPI